MHELGACKLQEVEAMVLVVANTQLQAARWVPSYPGRSLGTLIPRPLTGYETSMLPHSLHITRTSDIDSCGRGTCSILILCPAHVHPGISFLH